MVYSDIDDVTGDGDSVVIDVRAAGVCFPDLLLTKGEYQLKLPPPFVPGMETAGVVRSAPDTSGFQVGERVSAFGVLGGYAERVAVPVANVVRSPAELDDAQAVSLLVNYNTMYFALARRAPMRPGDTVLVLGAAGGVGTAAIQIAKAMGASQVIAVTHREGATDYVASLGADVVLPLTDGWAERVHEHTHGQGVDIVIDPIGGPTFDDAIRVLAIDGKLLVIGFAAGGIPTVKVNRLLLRNVSVVGVAWGEYLNQVPGSAALFSAGLGQLVSLGLKPPAPQRYPLSEAQEALQCLADGGVLGKLVLEP
jgi:NADPH:quinone reductase